MSEKEMMERYIYEVTKRVPQDAREEIRMELQTLIEDMCAEENVSVEEALQTLGSPAEFAKRYRDGNNYLIGPEYYDDYIWVLKLALIGIGISAVISAVIQGILNTQNWTDLFKNFFQELFTTAINGTLSAVGIVTIIFACLEWQKVKVALKPKENWTVKELSQNAVTKKIWTPLSLPPIPDKRAIISRGDSVVSIIFISVFAALLLFAPQLFGAFHHDGKQLVSISCIFNLEEWSRLVPVLIVSLFIALADEIIRLVTGYYCKAVMCSTIICNLLQMICAVILLKVLPLWNPHFPEDIQALVGINKYSTGDILYYWGSDHFNTVALLILAFATLLEIGVTVYKTLRYGNNK